MSYLVQTFIEGRLGTTVPAATAWYELGRCAGQLGRMALSPQAPHELFSRFGRDLLPAWQAHVNYNLGELNSEDPLLTLGVYTLPQLPRLRNTIAELGEMDFEFGLAHGDLAPRNLILSTDDVPFVLDWGSASTGPAPWGDLETVYRWHVIEGSVTYANLERFASGLGVDIAKCVPTVEALLLLRRLDLVRWAMARRLDLLTHYRELAITGVRRFLAR